MATVALARPESRGSHYREDHPDTDERHSRNIILDRSSPDGYFAASLAEL